MSSKKKTSDLESAAGLFAGLLTNIMGLVREESIPFEVVRKLASDAGRETLRRMLLLALDEYIEANKVGPSGPHEVELYDMPFEVLLLALPKVVSEKGEEVVAWAREFQVKAAPLGFLPANRELAEVFVQDKTCDMYVLEKIREDWYFQRLLFVQGKLLSKTLVPVREMDVPVLLIVAKQ
jgi:hypothetical protein